MHPCVVLYLCGCTRFLRNVFSTMRRNLRDMQLVRVRGRAPAGAVERDRGRSPLKGGLPHRLDTDENSDYPH